MRNCLIVSVAGLVFAISAPLLHSSELASAEPTEQVATTPAEHSAAAQRYEKEATTLDRKAASHRKLATSYATTGGSKASAGASSMAQHCRQLAASYARAAQDARELARAHRNIAK